MSPADPPLGGRNFDLDHRFAMLIFVCDAGYSIGMDPGVAITVLDQAYNLQVTYGAVMLSFLGSSILFSGALERE